MIEVIKAFIYGIVEGITEWLPISSTGHMILLNEFMPLKVSSAFWEMFLVVVQLGAILAVIFMYWKKIVPWNKDNEDKYHWSKPKLMMWVKILIASIPSAIVGVFLDDYLNKYLYNALTVSIMLIVFGVLFIIVETRNRKNNFINSFSRKQKRLVSDIAEITYTQVIIIGVFQMIAAILPGTSRSGATIIAGLLVGCTRCVSAEFTFFLAIPAMLGASLLKIIKFGFEFTYDEVSILLVGTITSFFVSIYAIKYLMQYIKKHDFEIFGYYRIILGLGVLGVLGPGLVI